MSDVILTSQERTGGRDYLTALSRLGMNPQLACWLVQFPTNADGAIIPGEPGQKSLAIITSWLDRFGAVDLYDLLFKAYDAAATPREIDPFIVMLLSPKSDAGRMIVDNLKTVAADPGMEEFVGRQSNAPIMIMQHIAGFTLNVFLDGIYVNQDSRPAVDADIRNFHRFKRHIERLAVA